MMEVIAYRRNPTHRIVEAPLARKAPCLSRFAAIAHAIGQVIALNRTGVGRLPPQLVQHCRQLPFAPMSFFAHILPMYLPTVGRLSAKVDLPQL